MKESSSNEASATQMLFPYSPEQFWLSIRMIIRQEVSNALSKNEVSSSLQINGLVRKPVYKIAEICEIFQVSKPTIYEWVRHGKLKPYKIRSRVYFLWQDIQKLLQIDQETIK